MFGPTRYYYHPERDISAAVLEDEHCIFAVRPGDMLHTKIKVLLPESDEEVEVEFTATELDQIIAELQRARAGCFVGAWPRPYVPKTVAPYLSAPVVQEFEFTVNGDAWDALRQRLLGNAGIAHEAIAEHRSMTMADAYDAILRQAGIRNDRTYEGDEPVEYGICPDCVDALTVDQMAHGPVPAGEGTIPSDVDTVGKLVVWLEENFGWHDTVGRLEIDIEPQKALPAGASAGS